MTYYRSYEDEDEYKVFLYYLDGKLYAWTIRKEDKEFFESQRNMKLFKRKKKILEPVVFRSFMSQYKDQQILDIPLESNGKTYLIRGTYAEDTKMTLEIEDILKALEHLDLYFLKVFNKDLLPEKYEKAVKVLLSYQSSVKNKEREFHVNSLSIFYDLFKFTF